MVLLDNDESTLKRAPLRLQGTLIIDTLTNLDAEKYKQPKPEDCH